MAPIDIEIACDSEYGRGETPFAGRDTSSDPDRCGTCRQVSDGTRTSGSALRSQNRGNLDFGYMKVPARCRLLLVFEGLIAYNIVNSGVPQAPLPTGEGICIDPMWVLAELCLDPSRNPLKLVYTETRLNPCRRTMSLSCGGVIADGVDWRDRGVSGCRGAASQPHSADAEPQARCRLLYRRREERVPQDGRRPVARGVHGTSRDVPGRLISRRVMRPSDMVFGWERGGRGLVGGRGTGVQRPRQTPCGGRLRLASP